MPARRKATKKAVSKKKVTKKAPAKKKSVAKKTVKKSVRQSTTQSNSSDMTIKRIKTVKEPMTKSQLYATLAEGTGVSKKDITNVLDYLGDIVHLHVKRSGPQTFTLPGLLKVKTVRKKATKARKGINPFTGEETIFKAKPARNVVKVLPLKKLKEMAE